MLKTIKITIKGKVQGVSFRQFVKDSADKLGITGTAENLYNNSVEVFATEEEDDLNEFIKKLRIGPPAAEVESIEKKVLGGVLKFQGFKVKR
ncbi:acylphosphatase [Patescibacteria group bacterium]